MDDGLKQRLIGAFVLLALAVIFVPVFFDREHMAPVDRASQIPSAPHIEPLVIDAPVLSKSIDSEQMIEEMYLPDEKQAETLEPEPLGFDSDGVPNSWVLQIASFRIEKHANKLRDKLLADGHAAYTRRVDTDRGKMTRLYVGPKLDKSILIASKNKIDKKYGVSSILLKFEAY